MGELFNSVNSPLTGKKGEVTAVVAKACCIVTENLVRKNLEHSTGCVIKILLDSGSNCDLLFHEKTERHFCYLTRQVPKSWHTSNGSFLAKGRSKVSLKFFEYLNSKEYLVTPGVVEFDKNMMTSQCLTSFLDAK